MKGFMQFQRGGCSPYVQLLKQKIDTNTAASHLNWIDSNFSYDTNNNLSGNISGVISERDYVAKIALLGRVSKETTVKEISTKVSNLITATPQDSVDACMEKMLAKDIRHLPLLDDSGKVWHIYIIFLLMFNFCVQLIFHILQFYQFLLIWSSFLH